MDCLPYAICTRAAKYNVGQTTNTRSNYFAKLSKNTHPKRTGHS